MIKKLWTSEEIAYVRNNYEWKTSVELGGILNRTENSVANYIHRHGLRLSKNVRIERHTNQINKVNEKKKARKVKIKFSGYSIYSVTFLAYLHKRKRVKRQYTPDEIFSDVCTAMEVDINEVVSKKRDSEYTFCRQLYVYLLKCVYRPDMTLKQIGRTIGKDYTTVISGIQKISGGLKTKDPKFMSDWYHYTKNSKYYNDGKKEL